MSKDFKTSDYNLYTDFIEIFVNTHTKKFMTFFHHRPISRKVVVKNYYLSGLNHDQSVNLFNKIKHFPANSNIVERLSFQDFTENINERW